MPHLEEELQVFDLLLQLGHFTSCQHEHGGKKSSNCGVSRSAASLNWRLLWFNGGGLMSHRRVPLIPPDSVEKGKKQEHTQGIAVDDGLGAFDFGSLFGML